MPATGRLLNLLEPCFCNARCFWPLAGEVSLPGQVFVSLLQNAAVAAAAAPAPAAATAMTIRPRTTTRILCSSTCYTPAPLVPSEGRAATGMHTMRLSIVFVIAVSRTSIPCWLPT